MWLIKLGIMGNKPGRLFSFTLAVLAVLAVGSGQAMAQTDLISPDTFSGLIDARLVSAGSETSFVDGGFGKSRFGEGRDGARLAEVAVAWNPQFTDNVSAVVSGEHQDGQNRWFDVGEAYLRYRSDPQGPLRITARAGAFYPDISLEHDGLDWSVPDTITPSAINSWVGEEVKVEGAEATLHGVLFGQDLALTAAGFVGDDTSGTLLSLRGWSLQDMKATLAGTFKLPPLSAFLAPRQRDATTSSIEIDNKVGVYGGLTWRLTPAATLNLFTYNNEGNKVGVTPLVEWAWATRFTEAGAKIRLSPKTLFRAQALRGETEFGFQSAQGIWVDTVFSSEYASLTRDLGKSEVTGRVDLFGVTDRSTRTLDNNDEHGWSATAAWRRDLNAHANVVLEALYVDSTRPSRPIPHEAQTVLQTALRLRF
jgi:hypothetical protein